MSTSGPLGAGTGSDDAGVGTIAWSSPGNVTADDASYASAALLAGEVTHYLLATNFGFSIPTGSTIDGITVEIEGRRTAGTGLLKDNRCRIIKGGVIGATDKASASTWSLSPDIYLSHGGASDLWGETWSVDDINAANFGVAISAKNTSAKATVTAGIDYIRITINYTAPATGQPTGSRNALCRMFAGVRSLGRESTQGI